MRFLTIIIFSCLLAFACVKKSPQDPVPILEYKDFQAWKYVNGDTAILTISYNDYDGDLFRNETADGPNTIIRPFVFIADSNKFIKQTLISYAITQPGDGFYKGKSIKGDIIIPMRQFRPNNDAKILKFEVFMEDMKKNKSNTVVTPQFTLNF